MAPLLAALRHELPAQVPQRLQEMLEHGLRRYAGLAPLLPPLEPAALDLPLPLLARQLGISVRQFQRRCLSCLGMPLREYRRLARYGAAMTALMLQGAPARDLARLALDAGYVDQAHFTRAFTAMVGVPPGRLLRQRVHARYQLWQFTPAELESYLR